MNPLSLLNGRATAQGVVRKRVTHASSLSASNAYNINAGSGAVNNNNNKNNSNGVRAVVALGNEEKSGWIDAYFDWIRHKLTAKQCNEYRIEFERDFAGFTVKGKRSDIVRIIHGVETKTREN